MSDEIVLKDGSSVNPKQIRDYFNLVLEAERSGEQFPVDFDLVWPLAYSTKGNAKKALVNSEEFWNDEDYHVIQNDNMVERPQGGGPQPEKIFLSLSCLEYFIARKVRPVFEIYRQCRIVLAKKVQTNSRYPYHIRRYITNHHQVPIGYFSILQQMTMQLIAPLEFHGYSLPEEMVPDISEGRIFCKWLRDVKGIDPNSFPTYDHKYEDGRVVQAKLYPLSLLSDYVQHFQDEWMQNRAPAYFKNRDASVVALLPQLQKQPAAITGKPSPVLTKSPSKP